MGWVSRRRFGCILVSVAAATPCLAVAQASKVVRRIGVLEPNEPFPLDEIRKFVDAPLRKLGWIEGQNLHVERRYGNGRLERLPALAEELVQAKVEIVVTGGTAATLAAKRATTTIPIVFEGGDPVLLGLVASLARPGGNVTGFSNAGPEVAAKQLSLLKELLPRLQRVGMLSQTGDPYDRVLRGQFEQVCQSLDLVPVVVEIGAATEINSAIARLARQRAQALVLQGTAINNSHAEEVVDAATRRGLPTMAHDESVVREVGALLAYSPSNDERLRARADYIDRILRGAKPADLPVRQPTKFDLVISLKTARTFGITIPKEVILRADDVIE